MPASSDAARLLRRLTGPATGSAEADGARPVLDAPRVEAALDALARRLAASSVRRPPAPDGLKAKVLADGKSALRKLAEAGEAARLQPAEAVALEAVIRTDGSRPVLFVQDDALVTQGVVLGEWEGRLNAQAIGKVAPSVGRIGVRQSIFRYQGTGFVVGEDLLLTNRHVLQLIGVEEDGAWRLDPEATVDFAGELTGDDEAPRRDVCALHGVLFCGPQPILGVDLARLDLALLRFKPNGQKRTPVALSPKLGRVSQEAGIYVMGFPQIADLYSGDADPEAGTETAQILTQLFGDEFGVKRLAPGRVDAAPGYCDDGGRAWAFEHDCSTLGGNSGSVVVDLRDGSTAVGLHLGGAPRRQNYAYALAALRGELSSHGVAYASA